MYNSIETLLGTADYPVITAACSGLMLIFMTYAMMTLLFSIFKFIGGWK